MGTIGHRARVINCHRLTTVFPVTLMTLIPALVAIHVTGISFSTPDRHLVVRA